MFQFFHAATVFRQVIFKMARSKTVSVEIRSRIIQFYKQGVKQCVIAKNLLLTESTVSRIIKRFCATGNVVPIKNTGRPRKTIARVDRKIINISENAPFTSSSKIKGILEESGGIRISDRTIRRRLVEGGLRSYKAVKKPLLRKKNVSARLQFALEHIAWTFDDWKKVVFSDESKFNLFGSDGAVKVRRPKSERLNKKYTVPTVKHGGGSVLVWGCFSGFGIGPLHRIRGKMDRFMYKDILNNILVPYTDEVMPLTFVFQHDNDPKHTSKFVKEWLKNEKIKVLKWPAQSPDLNPIENLWEIVNKNISPRNFKNVDQLFDALVEAWNNIDRGIIYNLIKSLPKRCADVIKAKGYYTKY